MPDDKRDEDHKMVDRAWELAQSQKTAILISWDGQRQRARPMAATVKRGEHAIYFLASAGSHKMAELSQYPTVTAAFQEGDTSLVSIIGRAAISDDRARIRELWTPFAKAWWESADDPDIRVITLTPTDAELWDSPNKLIASVIMLSAAVTGGRPDVGDHAQVKI